MEIWDAYDSNFKQIENMSLVREERIPEGVFHLVCEVIVKHADGDYLLMKRDAKKPFGGMWEATAGGSALQGEGPLECAKRELREETGIVPETLTEIGRVVSVSNHSLYVDFLCLTAGDKDGIILREGETSDYKWVSGGELRNMTEKELVTKRIQKFIQELHR